MTPELVVISFIPSHCWAPKPMKNLTHKVNSLISNVAVAAICTGTPKKKSKVVSVISGSPTSNGTPMGTDFTAIKIDEITSIALQLI